MYSSDYSYTGEIAKVWNVHTQVGLWAWKHKFQYVEVIHDVLFLCQQAFNLFEIFQARYLRVENIVIMKVTLLLIWCWWVKSDMGFL